MTRTTPLAAGLLAAALVTGCGATVTGSGTPAPSSGASTSTTASGTDASANPSTSVPGSASPSVTPATGDRFDVTAYTVVIPAGWDSGGVAQGAPITSALFVSPDQTTLLNLFRVVALSDISLDEAAQTAATSSPGMQRQPDREVGGRPAFVLTGDDADGTVYLVGGVAGQGVGTIDFTFAPESVSGKPADPAAQQALIESVLATVEWQD